MVTNKRHPALMPLLFLGCIATHCSGFSEAYTSPNSQENGYFGQVVSWTVDLNNDSLHDMALAAPWESVNGIAEAGKVYLIDPATGSTIYSLASPEPQASANFGMAMAYLGGLRGDGAPDLAIGAPNEDSVVLGGFLPDVGKVYLYGGLTGANLVTVIASPNEINVGYFGAAIARIMDVTGDGFSDIAIGAPGESWPQNMDRCGRVYIFDGFSFQLFCTLDPPDPESGASFGAAIADVPDISGDGLSEVLVGSPLKDVGDSVNAGQAYIFNGATGALIHTVTATLPQAYGQFGFSVAGFSGLTSDSGGDFAVGAPLESIGTVLNAGHVYLFDGMTAAAYHMLHSPNTGQSGWFGYSLAHLWDANGDDQSDLLVGAVRESLQKTEACGRAYIFEAVSGALLHTLDSLNPFYEGAFGASVSEGVDINNDSLADVLVGANNENANGIAGAGSAYLYSSPDYQDGAPEGEGQTEGLSEGEGQSDGEGATPTTGRVTIDISKVDDKAWVYVNGMYALRTEWGVGEGGANIGHLPGLTGEVDITHLLHLGQNNIRMLVWNAAVCCGVSGDFNIRLSGDSIYHESISQDDSAEGIRFDDTFSFYWDGPGSEGGNNGAACEAHCQTAAKIEDADGDGLSSCVENCLGCRDDRIDTDGDGIPDGWEVWHALEPTIDDADLDPDDDTLTNLEEYLERSHPRNPYSPGFVYYVAPATVLPKAAGHGTKLSPWSSITEALNNVSAAGDMPIRVVLAPGVYTENVTMEPGLTLIGESSDTVQIQGTIIGADDAELRNVTIQAPSTGNSVLLDINAVAMRVRNVVFQGTPVRPITGIRLTGNAAAASLIENCRLNGLNIGIEIFNDLPVIRRCVFEQCAQAAIAIRGTGPVNGSLGDAANPNTGWNTFRVPVGISAVAVINERSEAVKMQNNDWNTTDLEEVQELIDGPAEVGPVLAVGSAVMASALFCTLWDTDTQAPVRDASVQISPSVYNPVTQNINGVYAFPAIPQGTYTVTAIAEDEYEGAPLLVNIGAGQTVSVTLPLTPLAQEGEGEGSDDDYSLTIAIQGQGATSPAAGTHSYAPGTSVTITATPASGWQFDEWTGAASGSQNPINIVMNSDQNVTAVFSSTGCGCGKSAPAAPQPGELFLAALSVIMLSLYNARCKNKL